MVWIEHTNFGRWLFVWIVQSTFQLLHLPSLMVQAFHYRLRIPCSRRQPIKEADSVGETAGGREKQKTWLLPSRNLLSSRRNKKCTHQGWTVRSTKLVEGTESIGGDRAWQHRGWPGRWVTVSWILQDGLKGTKSKFLTRLRDLVEVTVWASWKKSPSLAAFTAKIHYLLKVTQMCITYLGLPFSFTNQSRLRFCLVDFI